MRLGTLLKLGLITAIVSISQIHTALTAAEAAWPAPTRDTKPWTRWWWLGNAVDETNLTRELTLYTQAGLGGVEITPIYGAKGAEDRFIQFLSPRYVEVLTHTANEAKRLDLGVDMATGTGWPFGGPQVRPEDAELKITLGKDGALEIVPTNFRVKRSAPGGQGLVLDPYSTTALSHYLEPITAALSKLPPGSLHGQFHDSFEYQGNWTRELPAAFEKQHGYTLADHAALLVTPDDKLAELSPEDADTLARIKTDYRETLASLHMDYIRAWVAWTHSLGGIAREQAHGAPANLLDLYALADIPETEAFGSSDFPIPGYRNLPDERSYNTPQPLVSRMASSAAHLTGKNLVSSETFTWAREHFHEAPSELKPELDQLYLAGINHVFYHGTAYSPEDAPWPGWLFYASTQYNPRNPLWPAFSELNAYITRVQSFLQKGRAQNDVLLYWPLYDLWHNPKGWNRNLTMHDQTWLGESNAGNIARALVSFGRQFDFVSDAQLLTATCEKTDRLIVTPGGGAFKQLVVPPAKYMPPETFAAIKRLADEGAHIIFIDDLPRDVPGLANLDDRRAQLAKLQFGFPPNFEGNRRPQTLSTGFGTFIIMPAEIFMKMPAPLANNGLGMTVRTYDDGEIYFLANLTDKPYDGPAILRVGRFPDKEIMDRETATLYDPRTGAIGSTPINWIEDRQLPHIEVRLQLQPGETIIVKTTRSGETAPVWNYTKSNAEPTTLASEWNITFTEGAPVVPPAYKTTTLESWTTQGGEAERYAGSARYETTIVLTTAEAEAAKAKADAAAAAKATKSKPAKKTDKKNTKKTPDTPPVVATPATPLARIITPAQTDDWELDLGDVREVARVFINGQQVDYLWSLPYRTRIGKYLKPGENTLAIEVTNLAANRIRDMDARGEPWKAFHEINFVNAHYNPLDASQWPLQPSGLLGPVRLTPLRYEK